MTASAAKPRHPKGLPVLFFTEMWERFGFYTMSAILVLYLDEYFHFPATGQVYGIFLALIYFSPVFGGYTADRLLGFRRSIAVGAALMAAAYALLAVPVTESPEDEAAVVAAETRFAEAREAYEQRYEAFRAAAAPGAEFEEKAPEYEGPGRTARLPLFFGALLLLVLGNALFKPNISVMVGNLYEEGSPLKDAAFNIFYMGINVGSLLAYISAAALRNTLGWSAAYAAAAVGMALSLGIFWRFRGHVTPAASAPGAARSDAPALPSGNERERVVALVVVFAITIIFWMCFFQNGSALTLWARDNTGPLFGWQIPPEAFGGFNALFIVLLTPVVVWGWNRLGRLGREPSTPGKIGLGMLATAGALLLMALAGLMGGDHGRVSPLWLVGGYFVLTIGELFLSPMGLSLVSKVAPRRMRGLMMGGWFTALAAGGYLAGALKGAWDNWTHSTFFVFLAALCLVAAALLALVLKRLKRVTG